MYEMTAYCGLDCENCPAYLATQSENPEELKKVVAIWWKAWRRVPPESVICDGCKSETGRICVYCSICEVRKCAEARRIPTCAHCEEYACEKLERLPAYVTAPSHPVRGKDNLDNIRRTLNENHGGETHEEADDR